MPDVSAFGIGGQAAIRMDFTELDKLVAECPERADKIVRQVAFRVERGAKQNVTNMNAVDTGALLNSIYTTTSKSDGFAGASAAAETRLPGSVAGPIPSGHLGQAFVGPCVEHGLYVELGTSRMPARPFLTLSVENERARWESGGEFAEMFK